MLQIRCDVLPATAASVCPRAGRVLAEFANAGERQL
jgi:hypothetical protein